MLAAALGFASEARTQAPAPRFRVLVIAELLDPSNADGNEIHRPYVEAAKIWLNKLGADSNFTVTYLDNPNTITDTMLSKVDLVWQMNYTPFRWNATAKAALEKYLDGGKGGWLGDHHATLYGSAVTSETWPWYFNNLIGGINYKNYISKFASGNVRLEDSTHALFKGVPTTFNVSTEEWYTWDKTPRPKVHVLANVDESSYKFVDPSQSGTKMGDHPVIWTNDNLKARNLYIFMGHHPNLFTNTAYTTLLRNAVMWVANKPAPTSVKPGNRSDEKGIAAAGRIQLGSDSRYITISAPGASLRSIDVLDASGRTLYHAAGKDLGDRVDRSHWNAGRYLVRTATETDRFSQWLELR
ncbi:MAG: putative secreted glycosyl hydrolase [Fibrobacteres bacterium]|nr:putative secreted glycosyl hydrolase [Fibrobacterota bacterium]